MKLIYIYHSAYAILTNDATIIIDYYQDSDNDRYKGVVCSELLNRKGKLYVLSTHSHHDHYNPQVLNWRAQRPDIVYIFSKEIQAGLEWDWQGVHFLDKHETYTDNILRIKAYGSTDVGGSFYIELADRKIFHAGDLNNWHWNEESTPDEIDEAERFYRKELQLLSNDVTHLDLAMFPLDPHLGKDFMKGAEEFISAIKTDILTPMHFGEAYEPIKKFDAYAQAHNCKYVAWSKKNQSINF